MKPQNVYRELTDLVAYLLEADIALTGVSPIVRQVAGGAKVVGTPPVSGRAGLMGSFGRLDEYRSVLLSGDYLVVLRDGSLLQVEYRFDADDVITYHRLAYFPCPVELSSDELEALDDLDAYIGMTLHMMPLWPNNPDDQDSSLLLRLRTPIRFDFDPEFADESHSPCHLHVSTEACRIPVAGPLSVGHFVRFVFRNFLHEVWSDHQTIRDWPIDYGADTIRLKETTELHVQSKRPAPHALLPRA